MAQAKGTSRGPCDVLMIRIDATVAMAEGAETGIEGDESRQVRAPNSHAETSQVHTMSEK